MSLPSRQRRSTGAILLEFLGSMNLAITLLVAISIAAVIGTVLQQNQPYSDYVIKFGPFWFEVFKTLGLFDVYGSGWFLGLLGFLLISTAVCVYRNAPHMLRDMRQYRLDVQDKSLRGFHLKGEWRSSQEPQALISLMGNQLGQGGFRVRVKEHEDRVVVAGMKGTWNRLGYLLSHLGIVVICIGGLIDGNLPLKLAERFGDIKAETRDLPSSEVPEQSTLPPDNTAFRGSVRIPEGAAADFVFLNVRDGYLLQKLPFRVELKDFRIEHYPSGQPKSFESDVLIHDPELDAPLERTIAVNHPLVYKGFAIYQASFSDGGSKLNLRAWSLDAPGLEPLRLDGAIYQKLKVMTPRGPMTLELDEFKLYNIFPADEGSGRQFQNYGPSFTFKLRNAAGEAREYVNYMAPVTLDGRQFFMSGMRSTPAEAFRYLYLPVDPKGSVERFMRLRAAALDDARVRRVVAEQSEGLLPPGSDAKMREDLTESLVSLTSMFTRGGMDAVLAQVDKSVPAAERDQAMQSYIAVLQSLMAGLYMELLADEGMDVSQGVGDTDARFFEDALESMAAMGTYGAPLYMTLDNFTHVEATGLQITRAPGQDIVYLGCVMLMAGVFFMFYLHHRRVWVSLSRDESGTRILVAGSGNRDRSSFSKEFEALSQGLQAVSTAADGTGATTTTATR